MSYFNHKIHFLTKGRVYQTRGKAKKAELSESHSQNDQIIFEEQTGDEQQGQAHERNTQELLNELRKITGQSDSDSSIISLSPSTDKVGMTTQDQQTLSKQVAGKRVSPQPTSSRHDKKSSCKNAKSFTNAEHDDTSDEDYQPGDDVDKNNNKKNKLKRNKNKKNVPSNNTSESEVLRSGSSSGESGSSQSEREFCNEEEISEEEVEKHRKNRNPTKIRNYYEDFKSYYRHKNKKKTLCWKAKCKKCSHFIRDQYGTTSNLWSHLRKKHPELHLEINQSNKMVRNANIGKMTQEQFNEVIVIDLIIKGGYPMNIVENKGFLSFTGRFWSHLVISKKQVRLTKIPELVHRAKTKLKCMLAQVKHVSLTIDFWSDRRRRSFMAITCHFVNDELVLKRYLLCLKYIMDGHTGDNIEEWYNQVISEYELRDKIFRITTDNASYMIKAFMSNLVTFEPEGEDSSTYETNEEEEDRLVDHQLDLSVAEFNRLLHENGAKRIPCFIHSLQLAIKDGLNNKGDLASALEKAGNIANATHRKDVVARYVYENNLKSVPLACATRWNGQLDLIRTVVEIAPKLNYILHPELVLTSTERRQLKEFVRMMSPFEDATKKCEGEYVPTVNHVLPKVISLYNHLSNLLSPASEERVGACKSIARAILAGLEARFYGLIDFIVNHDNTQEEANSFADKVFVLGTMLDPNSKLYWIDVLPHKNESEKSSIRDMCKTIMLEEMALCNTASQAEGSQTRVLAPVDLNNLNTQPKIDKSIFTFRSQMIQEKRSNSSTSSSNQSKYSKELNDFLEFLPNNFNPETDDDIDMAQFWLSHRFSFPYLAEVYKKVISCTASSAPSERVFSKAGIRMSPRRSRSKHDTISMLVFLDMNYELV